MGDSQELLTGKVIRVDSGASQVDTPAGVLRCVVRGRFAAEKAGDKRMIAVGDDVRVHPLAAGSGAIEEILPRRTKLSRRAVGQNKREQVVAANIDQVVIVTSLAEPPLNLNLVDRYLVAADSGGLTAVICINKIDLGSRETAEPRLRPYVAMGHEVVWSSARTGAGIDELKAHLAGRSSVLAGASGTGKSALLNAVEPGLELRSGDVSAATGKGRHTTTFSSLLRLTNGGYVIDTPGIREYTLWEVDSEVLDRHFPDVSALRTQCRFTNCTHSHEPDCAVKAGAATGAIDPRRYESYLRILGGLEDD